MGRAKEATPSTIAKSSRSEDFTELLNMKNRYKFKAIHHCTVQGEDLIAELTPCL